MIRKVLIACGGEVAARLLPHFANSHVQTVALYTAQDSNSEHVKRASSIKIGRAE